MPGTFGELRLQAGSDCVEQAEAHPAVVACERDHEPHSPMPGSVGIARQRADTGKSAGLEKGTVPAPEQVRMGMEEVKHLGETTGREAVAPTYARAFLQLDGFGEAVRDEYLIRDPPRLLEAYGCPEAMRAHLEEDLVGDVVVRGEEQFGKDLGQGA